MSQQSLTLYSFSGGAVASISNHLRAALIVPKEAGNHFRRKFSELASSEKLGADDNRPRIIQLEYIRLRFGQTLYMRAFDTCACLAISEVLRGLAHLSVMAAAKTALIQSRTPPGHAFPIRK